MKTKEISTLLKFLSLALSIFIGTNVLMGNTAIIGTGILLIAIAARVGAVPVLVSIALFGLPFLQITGSVIGLTATQIVIALVFILLIITIKNSSEFIVLPRFLGIRRFFVWWLSLICIYSIFVVRDFSIYSSYSLQYLVIYGSFYALAGLLALKFRISLLTVLIISLPIFAFNYLILNASILSLSGITDAVLGLRLEEGFDAINGARVAGLLFLMPFVILFSERLSIRLIPYFAAAVVLSGPIAWYSYSRQVLLAVLFTALWIFATALLLEQRNDKAPRKKMGILLTILIITISASFFVTNLLENNSQSRLIQDALETGRSDLWSVSIALIFKNPLLGIGIGNLQKYTPFQWPHNWFIEAWLTLGLPGFLLAAVAAIVIWKALFNRSDTLVAGWVVLGFYFIITAQFSADIPRNSIIFFFLTFAFYATGLKSKHQKFIIK